MCGGISIHAPVWGATTALQSSYRSLLISIHAPVWGATFLLMRPLLSSGYFNPRTRMGCDLPNVWRSYRQTHFNPRTRMGCDKDLNEEDENNGISIHAPVWGATPLIYSRASSLIFQSTHPYGVRLAPTWFSNAPMIISIHAPVWGATLFTKYSMRSLSISIHAPVWGATLDCLCHQYNRFISIHAPVWGATFLLTFFFEPWYDFNPRTRMGCDIVIVSKATVVIYFNPRTRMGCDFKC